MKILLTGATGLLGREICKQLAEQNQESVRCLVRNLDGLLPHNFEQIVGDISDIPKLLEALEGVDIVIHTAALVSFNKKDKKELFRINVDGTANVVNACLEKKIDKLIHVSSVAAIGKPSSVIDSKEPVNVNETHKWQDSPINSVYSQCKYLSELEVWRGHAEGLKVVIVNPSVILGEGEWHKSSTQLFNYIRKSNPFFTNGFLNYVDVKDVARAIMTFIPNKIDGERFILNAGRVSFEEFFSKIASNLNKPKPKIKLGKKMIALLWRLEALRGLLTGSNPLITKETAYSARSNVYFENSKISRVLNITFEPLDNTIKRVCDYLKNQEVV